MLDEFDSALSSQQAVLDRVEAPAALFVCLVGGKHIVRHALQRFFAGCDITVTSVCAGETDLAEFLGEPDRPRCDAIVLILTGQPFGTFHRIGEVLAGNDGAAPLVVLSEQASRGQVYAALRIGAKAYVNLDAEPEELIKAIRMVGRDKVYLAPDAAELLVSDISRASESTRSVRLPMMSLSNRETEVIELLCEGLSSKEIARHLHISAKTVENHRYNIYRKCEVDSLAALMRQAIQHGLVSV